MTLNGVMAIILRYFVVRRALAKKNKKYGKFQKFDFG